MIALSANQFQELDVNGSPVAENNLSVHIMGTLSENLLNELGRNMKSMCVK